MDQSCFKGRLRPEQPRGFSISYKSGAKGIGKDHKFRNQRPRPAVHFRFSNPDSVIRINRNIDIRKRKQQGARINPPFHQLTAEHCQDFQFLIRIDHLFGFRIGKLAPHHDQTRHNIKIKHLSIRGEQHHETHRGPVLAGYQTAAPLGQFRGKHRNTGIRHVYGRNPGHGLLKQRVARFYIIRHIRDVDSNKIIFTLFLNMQGIIKIPGGIIINGENGQIPEILAPIRPDCRWICFCQGSRLFQGRI